VAAPASYSDIAAAYGAERDKYRRLGRLLADAIERDLLGLHMEVVVQTRAKDVLSFVKKALREGYADPLTEIGDKAGVRVIVHYLSDVERVEEVVESHCRVLMRESKLDALDFNELGYLGVHLDVAPRETLAEGDNADLRDLRAELQIHTKAQSAWAVVSHDQLYKTAMDIPSDLKRTIYRLVALVELFDQEVRRFVHQVHEHPEFKEMQILVPLDNLLIEFTPRRPDRALSALVVPALVQLHSMPADDVFEQVVLPFVKEHRSELDEIYERYADDDRVTPLLFQPEALLIFQALASDPYRLREAWPSDRLSIELLEGMAAVWGVDLEEYD
jgi:ppGpp synthetase/RelA/SpoT-type nucleotidyltranferase